MDRSTTLPGMIEFVADGQNGVAFSTTPHIPTLWSKPTNGQDSVLTDGLTSSDQGRRACGWAKFVKKENEQDDANSILWQAMVRGRARSGRRRMAGVGGVAGVAADVCSSIHVTVSSDNQRHKLIGKSGSRPQQAENQTPPHHTTAPHHTNRDQACAEMRKKKK